MRRQEKTRKERKVAAEQKGPILAWELLSYPENRDPQQKCVTGHGPSSTVWLLWMNNFRRIANRNLLMLIIHVFMCF